MLIELIYLNVLIMSILLKQVILSIPPNTLSSQPLRLYILDNSPQLYLCDNLTSICANFSQPKHQCSPYNRTQTPFYNPLLTKSALALQSTAPFDEIYAPRPLSQIQNLPLECINVSKWVWHVVNIANTGWYAPLLQVKKYQKTAKQNIRLDKVESILPLMKEKMEEWRLKDIKRRFIPNPQHCKVQTCFDLMHCMPNYQQAANFVKIDFNGEIVRFKNKPNYIPFNGIEGICCFQQALKDWDHKSMESITMKYGEIEESYDYKESPEEIMSNEDNMINEQLKQNQQFKEKQENIKEYQEYQSQNDDQEDILRNLYIKRKHIK